MNRTHTRTFVNLEVTPAFYDEVKVKLIAAGYDQAFIGESIDMHGIALIKAKEARCERDEALEKLAALETTRKALEDALIDMAKAVRLLRQELEGKGAWWPQMVPTCKWVDDKLEQHKDVL